MNYVVRILGATWCVVDDQTGKVVGRFDNRGLADRCAERMEAEAYVCEDCDARDFGGWNCIRCGSHNIRMLGQ